MWGAIAFWMEQDDLCMTSIGLCRANIYANLASS